MKKRIFTFMLALIMLLCAIPAAATETTEATEATEATEPTETTAPGRAPGYCGEAIVWSFSGGVLNITGAGAMDDFPDEAPWAAHKNEITTVIISGGITYVGARSFYNYDTLKTVQFGNDLREIGDHAFFSCDGLTVIYLPASFKVFGPSCFMGCTRLKEFHCEGGFPSFRQNCLWDTYAIIYFPAERPWSVEYIKQLEEAFHGRIEFLASDGSDPYDSPTVTAPPADSPTTEAPTEQPTEAPTTAPTEAPTTVPPTTVPPTTVPPTTEAPTEETSESPSISGTDSATGATGGETDGSTGSNSEPQNKGGFIPWLLVVGTICLFLFFGGIAFLCAAIIGSRKRGKYSR